MLVLMSHHKVNKLLNGLPVHTRSLVNIQSISQNLVNESNTSQRVVTRSASQLRVSQSNTWSISLHIVNESTFGHRVNLDYTIMYTMFHWVTTCTNGLIHASRSLEGSIKELNVIDDATCTSLNVKSVFRTHSKPTCHMYLYSPTYIILKKFSPNFWVITSNLIGNIGWGFDGHWVVKVQGSNWDIKFQRMPSLTRIFQRDFGIILREKT